jgi:AraC family transcriptional regulator of adaptative response / DNA-3-methyladenine glycosylase II
MTITRELTLAFAPPLDTAALLDHFARRAIPGIEAVSGARYVRSLSLAGGPAVAALTLPGAGPAGPAPRGVRASLVLADAADETAAIALLRALLDLDADPDAVTIALGPDPLIGAPVAAAPGRRVPGAAGATELALRALLGQQISLAAAATAAGRLVAAHGARLPEPLLRVDPAVTHLFPTAGALAAIDPTTLPMPRSRGRALVGLAAALTDGLESLLRRGGDGPAARGALLALPGIGPWTADYVVMRVLGDHDVLLATDLGIRRALQRAGLDGSPRAIAALGERWRPFRSYAMQYLWTL